MRVDYRPKDIHYVRKHRSFHLHYGKGSGWGQWELAHPFLTEDGVKHAAKEIGDTPIAFQIDPKNAPNILLQNDWLSPIKFDTTWELNKGHDEHARLHTGSEENLALNVSAQLAAALMLPETSGSHRSTPVTSCKDRFHFRHYWFDLLSLDVAEFTSSTCLISIRSATVGCMDPNKKVFYFDFDLAGRILDVKRICSTDIATLMSDRGIAVSSEDISLLREAFEYYRQVYVGSIPFDYSLGKARLHDIEIVLQDKLSSYVAGDDIVETLLHQLLGDAPLTQIERRKFGERCRSDTSVSPVPLKKAKLYNEGSIRLSKTVAKEQTRSPTARKECLKQKGTACWVCGFDSTKAYGIPGIIHVHHLNPLSRNREGVKTNPETDLVPLCPNCHAAIHSKKGGIYSIEELRSLIRAAESDNFSD